MIINPYVFGRVFQDTYSTYTPTFTGFSVAPTVFAHYINMGGMVNLWITPSVHGTSNANSFTFTLPIATANTVGQQIVCARVTDNGVSQSVPGLVVLTANSTTATVYKNSLASNTWTTSGQKSCKINILYEASGYSAYSPSFTGFSVNPTVTARYTQLTKFAHVYVNVSSHGTSNATTFTMTLPFTAANTVDQYVTIAGYNNNSTRGTNAGLGVITKNTNVMTIYRDMQSLAWTASGTKSAAFSIGYETV